MWSNKAYGQGSFQGEKHQSWNELPFGWREKVVEKSQAGQGGEGCQMWKVRNLEKVIEVETIVGEEREMKKIVMGSRLRCPQEMRRNEGLREKEKYLDVEAQVEEVIHQGESSLHEDEEMAHSWQENLVH